MKKFTILHLSDLHISAEEEGTQERLRESLINDVKQLLVENEVSIDAIVMTGDSVDRGGNDNSFKKAEDFYQKILSELDLKKNQLLIVPGNHDIPRRSVDEVLISNLSEEVSRNKKDFSEYYESIRGRYKEYNSFLDRIVSRESRKEASFGAAIQEIQNEKCKVRFLLLDSAWSTLGNTDYQNLYIGRNQMESLIKEIDSEDTVDLTFAMVHHPGDWLRVNERKMFFDYLALNGPLSVNAVFHGHIHNGNISTHGGPDGSLTSFVTGLGYPDLPSRDRGQLKLSSCRYSLYNFDLDKKEVEIWLRISKSNGRFVADTLLYESGGETGNFKLPFKMKESSEEVIESNTKETLTCLSQVNPQLSQTSGTLVFKHHLLYSVNTWLSYKISQFFYNDLHYVWCAPKLNAEDNPISANPLHLFRILKTDSQSGGDTANINRIKAGLLKGVKEQRKKGVISEEIEKDIISAIHEAEPNDFRPLLYIIPTGIINHMITHVPPSKKQQLFSEEYIIEALPRQYFDIVEF